MTAKNSWHYKPLIKQIFRSSNVKSHLTSKSIEVLEHELSLNEIDYFRDNSVENVLIIRMRSGWVVALVFGYSGFLFTFLGDLGGGEAVGLRGRDHHELDWNVYSSKKLLD